MPDDYPRDAWSPETTAPNIMDWEEMLEDYDLDVEPRRNPASFATIAQQVEIDVMRYKGVRINKEVESVNRMQVNEFIKLADERDLLRLIKVHLHSGNRKLPEHYLIYNLNPAHMCPSLSNRRGNKYNYLKDEAPSAKNSYCQAFNERGALICYAWGAELGYKDCFPYRIRQNEIWRKLVRDTPEIMIAAVEDLHASRMEGDEPVVAFRWSESGDIEDQKSLNAIMRISKALSDLPVPDHIVTWLEEDHEIPGTGKRDAKGKWIKGTGKIVRAGAHRATWRPGQFASYLYSARQDLDFSRAPAHDLVLLGSDWVGRGLSGQFVMVDDPKDPPAADGDDWKMCPMKCRICQRCPMGLSSKVLNH